MTNILIREKRERLRRRDRGKPCEDRDRDWSDTSTNQGRLPAPPEDRSEALNRFSLKSSRRKQPYDNLIADFWPPDYERVHFCC